MEVIKHGNTYKEIECKKCGALLSYCEADIKTKSRHGYYDFEEYFETTDYIECLECKEKINLKKFVDWKE